MIRKGEKAELRFIPMELDVRGFYSNWFYSHEARCFLFKVSFTSCAQSRKQTFWEMLFNTQMRLLAASVAR